MGFEEAAHEDRPAPTSRPAFHEIARDALGLDRLEAALEVVEPDATHRGIREIVRGVVVPLPHPPRVTRRLKGP